MGPFTRSILPASSVKYLNPSSVASKCAGSSRERDGRVVQRTAPFAVFVILALTIRFGCDRIFANTGIALGSTNVSVGIIFNVAFVFIGFSLLGYCLLAQRSIQSDATFAIILWAPFLTSLFGSLAYTEHLVEGGKFAWNVLAFFSLFIIGLNYSRFYSMPRMADIIARMGIFPILVSLVYLAIDGLGERMRGATTHPNILAFFLFFYIAFCYHGFVWGWFRSTASRWICLSFSTIATLELLLTGTRSAFIALFAFVLVSTLRKPMWLLAVLPAPFLALAIPSVYERVVEVAQPKAELSYEYVMATARGDTDAESAVVTDSGKWRMFLWQAAWPVILESPLLGHGASSFLPSSQKFFPLNAAGGSGAHNIYVQILFEQGVVGLLAYFWLIVGVCSLSILHWRRNPGVAIFIVMLIICFGVASFSDNMLYYLIVQIYIWFISGHALGTLVNTPTREGA